MVDLDALLEPVAEIAAAAGRQALEFYGRQLTVELKADNSPLTMADKASHRLIVAELKRLTPEIPVVSEESADGEAISLASDSWLWLVDPLDGTKEFIKQTGQFTVNIGLVHNGYPECGVIHVPVTGQTYAGQCQAGKASAWSRASGGQPTALQTRRANLDQLTVVASRDHAGPVVEAFLRRLKGADIASMGSSLKFCLVAEGKADFYPRVVPTFQWDTAAAQAILEAAGGHLTELDGQRLCYRKDRLRNPSVMAYGDNRIDWAQFFAADASWHDSPSRDKRNGSLARLQVRVVAACLDCTGRKVARLSESWGGASEAPMKVWLGNCGPFFGSHLARDAGVRHARRLCKAAYKGTSYALARLGES